MPMSAIATHIAEVGFGCRPVGANDITAAGEASRVARFDEKWLRDYQTFYWAF